MQSLFAYKQCKEAIYHLALEQLEASFLPDLNSMEVQDKVLLKAQSKEASVLFKKHYKLKDANVFEASEAVVNEKVMNAISFNNSLLKKDKYSLKEELLNGINQISAEYIWALYLPIALSEISKNEKPKKGTPPYNNFFNNKAIKLLADNVELENKNIKNSLSWEKYKDDVRNWVKNIIKQDLKFDEYLRIENPAFDQDKEILLYIIKSILFKNETINDFFELIDLHWSENKLIIKSLLTKTVKGLEEEQPYDLLELSYNWEEDLEFFKTIYNATLEGEDAYEEMIATKSKNWDIDRIATTDIVMLEMAIQEMIHFPSIPVKVTINEYIEISKKYSTPKSKQFVNGVLDVIAVDLQEQGVIKKSGRGLIDNK